MLQEEYAALMERCGAGVLVLDGVGRIQNTNRLMRRLLGEAEQSLIGESLGDVVHSEELTALLADVCAGKEGNSEIRVPVPGGHWLRVSISLIGEAGNENPRFLLVAWDVTELHRLERIRRDFVANVSHELRTPLASIRAMAETLQDGALEDHAVAERFLGTIITETQRLTRISEDLLILSNAESDAPQKAPFSLSHLLGEVSARFQPQGEKVGVALTTPVPLGLEVFANRDQIEQVVVNLIDNAIKYTPAGGHIRVSAERYSDYIAIHVADSGIGIQEKDLPRIFERFYRVDKARSRQSGGTGLGLSIVKHIVEAHGGQVTVKSRYGQGSLFTFLLPTFDGQSP